MSTLQQTKPRRANQSITEESGRPGTVRSKVGCEAIDDPCTKSTAGLPSGEPTNFSQRNRRTSPLWVQCSTPVTGISAVAVCAVMRIPISMVGCRSIDLRAGVAHDLRPEVALGTEEGAELRRSRADDLDAGTGHVGLHLGG